MQAQIHALQASQKASSAVSQPLVTAEKLKIESCKEKDSIKDWLENMEELQKDFSWTDDELYQMTKTLLPPKTSKVIRDTYDRMYPSLKQALLGALKPQQTY